jgi:hypothetical protein
MSTVKSPLTLVNTLDLPGRGVRELFCNRQIFTWPPDIFVEVNLSLRPVWVDGIETEPLTVTEVALAEAPPPEPVNAREMVSTQPSDPGKVKVP